MTREVVISRGQAAVLAELVSDGPSNAEIADRLGLGKETVKSHMQGLLRAFDRCDRAAIVADVLRRRVVVRVVKVPAWEVAS